MPQLKLLLSLLESAVESSGTEWTRSLPGHLPVLAGLLRNPPVTADHCEQSLIAVLQRCPEWQEIARDYAAQRAAAAVAAGPSRAQALPGDVLNPNSADRGQNITPELPREIRQQMQQLADEIEQKQVDQTPGKNGTKR